MEAKEKAAITTASITPRGKDTELSANSKENSEENSLVRMFAEMESKVEASREQDNKKGGMLQVMSANDTMRAAAVEPNPVPLWKELWNAGEMACVFGDTNCGKSIHAVQLADLLSISGHKVLYVDLELSRKQFQLRYTNELTGEPYRFSPNFYRAEITPDSFEYDEDFETSLLDCIRDCAIKYDCTVVIVDNLTYLCSRMEKGTDAALFMFRLRELKVKYNWSTLIIAHTPKRPATSPITLNDLAGSRKLSNFFDSIWAVGVVGSHAAGKRYIIQLKYRQGEYSHGSTNVLVCQISKVGARLYLHEEGCSDEASLLMQPAKQDPLTERIKELHSERKTQQQISEILANEGFKVNQSTISRKLRKLN